MTQPTTDHTSHRHHAKEPYTTPELVAQECLRNITATPMGDYDKCWTCEE